MTKENTRIWEISQNLHPAFRLLTVIGSRRKVFTGALQPVLCGRAPAFPADAGNAYSDSLPCIKYTKTSFGDFVLLFRHSRFAIVMLIKAALLCIRHPGSSARYSTIITDIMRKSKHMFASSAVKAADSLTGGACQRDRDPAGIRIPAVRCKKA